MGVQGLWQLLQSTGRPVTLESLEGKVLAIDVSIWLHKSTKGVRGKDGVAVPNAHLLSLFHRLCKLYFYRIKPIFVFDGGVPVLKRQTIIARKQKADLADIKSKKSTEKILANFIQGQALRKAAGKEPADITAILPLASTSEQDLFQLPPVPEQSGSCDDEPDTSWEERVEQREIIHSSFQDLREIDVTSDDFKALPPEIRHEILTELKETRKQSHRSRPQDLPQDSSDFSNFQMSRIIKKSKLTNDIEHARKEMNARSIEGVADTLPGSQEIESRRIMSRDASHVIFLKGVKNKIEASPKKSCSPVKLPAKRVARTCTSSKVFELISVDSQPNFAADTSTVKSVKSAEQRTLLPEGQGHGTEKDQGQGSKKTSPSKEGQGQRSEKSSASTKVQGQDSDEPSASMECQGQDSEKTSASVEGQGRDREKPSASTEVQGEDCEKMSAPAEGQGQDSQQSSASAEGQGQGNKKLSAAAEVVELDDSGSDVEFIGQEGMTLKDVRYRKHVHIRTKCGKLINCQLVPPCNNRSPQGGKSSDAPKRIVTRVGGSVESESGESDIEVMDVTQKLPSEVSPPSQRRVSVPLNSDTLRYLDDKYVHTPLESNQRMHEVGGAVRTGPSTRTVDMTGSSSDSDIEVVSQICTPKKSVHGPTQLQADSVHTCNHPGCIKKRLERSCVTFDSDDSDLEEIASPRDQSDPSTNNVACRQTRNKFGAWIRPNLNTGRSDNVVSGTNSGKDGLVTKKVTESSVQVIRDISDDDDTDESGDSDSDEVDGDADSIKERSPSVAVISDSSDEAETDEDDDFIVVEPNINSLPSDEPSTSKRQTVLPDSTVAMATYAVTIATDEGSAATELVDDEVEETVNLGSQIENLTKDDVDDILESLAVTKQSLLKERAKHEMMARTITEQMYIEAQGLLTLFGAPYVLSPMEAEAQCAYLDLTDQCDGSITEDSDTWLFGGKTVYKNFFNQDRLVECYRLEAIKQKLGLDREKLINIALMCGCDYTEGIQGVGPVTAVEIMAEFPGDGYEGLKKFKEWWDEAQKQVIIPSETKIKSKLRHLEIKSGFPSAAVVDAFINPAIDASVETFTWGRPDLDLLRDFATRKFGWTRTKTDELLLPVIKKMNAGTIQQTITKFFKPTFLETGTRNVKSKRLKRALNRVAGPPAGGASEPEKQTPDQTRLKKAVAKATQVLQRDAAQGKKGRKRKGKVAAVSEGDLEETEHGIAAEDGGDGAPRKKRGVGKRRGKAAGLKIGEPDSVAERTMASLDSEIVPAEGGNLKNTWGGGKRKKLAPNKEGSVVEGDGFLIVGADLDKSDDKDLDFALGHLSEGHDSSEDEGPVLAPKRGRGGKRGARGKGKGRGGQKADDVGGSTAALDGSESLAGEVGKGKVARGRGRGGRLTSAKKTDAVAERAVSFENRNSLLGEVGCGKVARGRGRGRGRGVQRGGRGKNAALLRHKPNVSLIRDEVNLSDESLDEFGSDMDDDILGQALDAVEQGELQPGVPESQTKDAGFLEDKETSTYFTEAKKAAKRPRVQGKEDGEAEVVSEEGGPSAKGKKGKGPGKKGIRGGKIKAGRGRGAKK